MTKGGNGEVLVTMQFGEDGKLRHVTQTEKVRPGPRPICQATKLLDPRPDRPTDGRAGPTLHGVGRTRLFDGAAELGTPEMQQAIDQLWRRIVADRW